MQEVIDIYREQSDHHEEVLDWISRAATDERKLLILLAISNSSEPLGASGIKNELNLLADEKLPGNPYAITNFVKKSLIPASAVESANAVIERRPGRPEAVPGYQITVDGRNNMGLAGALLEWSLVNPDVSLNQVFGVLNTKKEDWRTAAGRLQLLESLISNGERQVTPSMVTLARELSLPSKFVQMTVDRWLQFGIVVKESVDLHNQRLFKIIDPVYRVGRGKPPFAALKAETQLILNTMAALAPIQSVWQFDEFFKYAEHLHPDVEPEVLLKARDRLGNALKPEKGYFRQNVVAVSQAADRESKSKIFLTDTAKPMMTELVNIIKAFGRQDQIEINKGVASAKKIINSPADFRRLFYKAREASNYSMQDAAINKRLQLLVAKLGPYATARSLAQAYEQQTGRKLAPGVIQTTLGRLASEGVIEVQQLPHSKQRMHKENRYSLAFKN